MCTHSRKTISSRDNNGDDDDALRSARVDGGKPIGKCPAGGLSVALDIDTTKCAGSGWWISHVQSILSDTSIVLIVYENREEEIYMNSNELTFMF